MGKQGMVFAYGHGNCHPAHGKKTETIQQENVEPWFTLVLRKPTFTRAEPHAHKEN